MHRHLLSFLLVLCLGLSSAVLAAPPADAAKSSEASKAEDSKDEKKKPWDVEQPEVASRTQTIDVTQGTWMNLDVSPDGTHWALFGRTPARARVWVLEHFLPEPGGQANRR